MTHYNDEELIEHYYGESDAADGITNHLRECPDCAGSYATITRELDAIAPAATPARGEDYGQQVWDSIRGSLSAYEAPQKRRFGWLQMHPWSGFATAAACLLVIAAAFFAGRRWEHHNTPQPPVATNTSNGVSNDQGRQRVVLVVLGDHLDRSERLLVELKHAEPSTEGTIQAEARDLLSANRLCRESVKQAGDPVLASSLDHLERVLIEVANEPAGRTGISQARLDELQKEMNTDGLLFEVRVLRSRVREDAQGDVEQKPRASAATKGVSI